MRALSRLLQPSAPAVVPTSPPKLGKAAVATRYEYNTDEQLVSVTRPDAGVITFNLDESSGRLASLDFPEGSVALQYHPKTGQLSSATREATRLSYTYEGDLLARTTWAGDVAGSVTHTRDQNFWVVSEQVSAQPAIALAYDNDGLLVSAGSQTITRDAAQGLITATKLGSSTDAFSYSNIGEVSAYSASVSGKESFAQTFERDALGRITQLAETMDGETHTIEYSYHPRGWLESVTRDGAEEQRYEYDSNGNRIIVNADGKALRAEFDAQDRLTSHDDVNFSYSLNGELATTEGAEGATSYTYDALGNLLTVQQPKAAKVEYVIDAAGRRVGKKLDGKLTKGFLYRSALQPVAELDGAGNIVQVFVYATRSNVPDYLIRGTTTYRIISDLRGSPRLVINAATGAVAQRLDYDAWGNVTTNTSPGFQPFGFAGGLDDPDTGLVRFGARDYDASIGRWLSKDPILFGGGQANIYLYVENDPVNAIDPRGLLNAVKAGVGAANRGLGLKSFVEGLGILVAGTAALPLAGPIEGVPAYAYGGYKVASGVGKILRGGQQFGEAITEPWRAASARSPSAEVHRVIQFPPSELAPDWCERAPRSAHRR